MFQSKPKDNGVNYLRYAIAFNRARAGLVSTNEITTLFSQKEIFKMKLHFTHNDFFGYISLAGKRSSPSSHWKPPRLQRTRETSRWEDLKGNAQETVPTRESQFQATRW